MILRNFLYLDTAAVDNYLSALEGSILEGPIEQTDTKKGGKGGKAGLSKVLTVEGNISSETSSETKQKRVITKEAKFQNLYEILEEQEAIQLVDALDPDTWNQFRRGEVLEVEADTRIPDVFLVKEATEAAAPIASLMALFGNNPFSDPNTKQQFEVAGAAAELFEKQQIPLLFVPLSTPRLRFVAYLSRDFLRCKPSVLPGEATVFGKIQRVVPKGQEYEIPLVFSSLTAHLSPPNRAQRRKAEKNPSQRSALEVIKGPAIILEAIAVYR